MRFQRRSLLKLLAISPTCLMTNSTAKSVENDRSLDIHDQIVEDAEKAPLKMRFQGTSKGECIRWQKSFTDKPGELLGRYQPPSDWQTLASQGANA